MTCRTTSLGSAITSYARLAAGLHDQQTLSTYHEMQREGRHAPAPSPEKLNAFIDEQIAVVRADDRLTEARRRSIIARLNAARTQQIDGRTFYAVSRLQERARRARAALDTHYEGLARDLGISRAEVAAQVNALISRAAQAGRRAAAPAEWRAQFAARPENTNLPLDRQTAYALHEMELRRTRALLQAPTRPTVTRYPVQSRAVASVGYDPATGRLEIEMHSRPGIPYAYRVPPHVYQQLMSASSIGSYYSRNIRGNPAYQYATAADHDAAAEQRRCATCGQWAGAGHSCPVRDTHNGHRRTTSAEPAPGLAEDAPRREVTPLETGTRSTYHGAMSPHGMQNAFEVSNDLDQVRQEARRIGPVSVDLMAFIHRVSDGTPEGRWAGYNFLNGCVEVEYQPETGRYQVTSASDPATQLRCGCAEYQRRYDCPHVRQTLAEMTLRINNPDLDGPHELPLNLDDYEPQPDIPEPSQPSQPVRAEGRRRGYLGDSGGFLAPSLTAVRQTARQHGTAVANVRGLINRVSDGTTSGQRVDTGFVEGQVTVEHLGQDEGYRVTAGDRDLRCGCPEYQRNYDCVHVRQLVNDINTRINQQRLNSPHRIQEALAVVASDLARERVTSVEAQLAARAAWGPAEVSYSDDPDAFERAYDAAKRRKARGEEPVAYLTDNATDGLGARGTGRGFGVEIEFDVPSGRRRDTLEAIGRDLYAAGLTSSPYQQTYNAQRSNGYTDNHRGGWSFEMDSSVSGEIVSPIMYDEPETWENLAKVCQIVRRHGGHASIRAGSHVHISAGNYGLNIANHNRLLGMFKEHEDVIYRLSTNPERGTHRGLGACAPNRVPGSGYASFSSIQFSNLSRYQAINLRPVRGRPDDHIEYRTFDSTLNPAVIQTQIKMALAMTEAAFRDTDYTPGRPEALGAHHAYNRHVFGSRYRLTGEAWRRDTASFRRFADRLFRREVDKNQIASLFAVTNWQKGWA